MNSELDKLAEELYDWCNARRADNRNKDGLPGNPRQVSCKFSDTYEQVKTFYRSAVLWHQSKQTET